MWRQALTEIFSQDTFGLLLLTLRIVLSIFASMRYCLGDKNEHHDLWTALACMPFALFFDFMDGRIARWRRKSSLMGQELDSLADLVHSFLLL